MFKADIYNQLSLLTKKSIAELERELDAGNGAIGKAITRNSTVKSLMIDKIAKTYPEHADKLGIKKASSSSDGKDYLAIIEMCAKAAADVSLAALETAQAIKETAIAAKHSAIATDNAATATNKAMDMMAANSDAAVVQKVDLLFEQIQSVKAGHLATQTRLLQEIAKRDKRKYEDVYNEYVDNNLAEQLDYVSQGGKSGGQGKKDKQKQAVGS